MKKATHGGDIYSFSGKKVLDFSANINPLGLPKSVKEAIVANMDAYVYYPDPQCRELRLSLSKHTGLPMGNIVCGNGAADLIFRIVICLKPKRALILVPTFSEYEEALRLCECEIIYHFLSEEKGFVVDDRLLEKIPGDIDMIFICNPNNPTGIPIGKDFIIKIADKCKEENILLVVDECFTDFLEDEKEYSMVSELNNRENIIILKAFTKIYAMAGIRLGYALSSNTTLIDKISETLQPWSVSTVASKCGVAALEEKEYILRTKKIINENREYLIAELQRMNIEVFPSKANYVFFRCFHKNLAEKLEGFNILIRCCKNYLGLGEGYYRIAVRNTEDNLYFIKSLQKVLED